MGRVIDSGRLQAQSAFGLMRKLCAVLICMLCLDLFGLAQYGSPSSSANSATFTLSGTVVNSVTGEPIARALVRVSGIVQRNVFTDTEGNFQIDGLPPGWVHIELQKPGYRSSQNGGTDAVNIGANIGPVVLKLSPLGAIYGRVMDAAGQPIENLPLRLTGRSVRDGRLRWNIVGSTESDEDGKFRFQSLASGAYYLAAGPGLQREIRLLARDSTPKTGYPSLFYPGSPDLSGAAPIQLAAGQQAQADFSMPAVPVYKVSGTVANYGESRVVVLQVLNQSGDPISLATGMRMDGTFEIRTIPAGVYTLKASSHVGNQTLRAETRVTVAANLDNVSIALAPAPFIPITVRLDARDTSNLNRPGWNPQRPPVTVRLIPSAMFGVEPSSNFVQQSSAVQVMGLQDVEPGKYTAEVMSWGPWYVQSAQYGPTNLLSDDLTIVSGQTYPIEIVLRDDGATLTGNLNSSEKSPTFATVVVVPLSSSRRGAKVSQFSSQSGFTIQGLPPGDYLVFAFDHIDDLEYANPDVLQPYASQAAHVTLSPNQETHVLLNLIRTGEGE